MAIREFLRVAQKSGLHEVIKWYQEPWGSCCLGALTIRMNEGGIRAGLEVGGWRAVCGWDGGKGVFLIWVKDCLEALGGMMVRVMGSMWGGELVAEMRRRRGNGAAVAALGSQRFFTRLTR